ncbi:helix-turn-helix domain-containing protein [Rhizosphaericola mali]|uniref:Helix-turn-helix transcriptional regulator n=1 Tax=Rhizosphaericola mali TaxID=2545455 RepID=A0A5P2G1A8_9BACT|nr:helix-turn-helix transcriptional regulator [Rhizosphaericola mali]QES87620.1 helix-turn-helix transcriptional regulator [Rhizosphaericola mali]
MLDSVKSKTILEKIAEIFKNARLNYDGPYGYQRQRGRKGISLRDLAKHTGIKHTQISEIEKAKRNSGIINVIIIAEFLSIDLNKIIEIIKAVGSLVIENKND